MAAVKRGLPVDKNRARQILQEEALLSRSEPALRKWQEQVEKLSSVCEAAGVRSHIAVLGNAILAKATNLDIDRFSLKSRDDSPGAYSARGIADQVLGPWASAVGLNIGVSGANPLNNQPFFHATRVSTKLEGVKSQARLPLEVLCDALTEVSRIHHPAEARLALRAFIGVREQYSQDPPAYEYSASVAESPLRELIDGIDVFVREKSEGGRRAQAAAAGVLDTLAGPDRVRTRRINDPSRDSPGDIAIVGVASTNIEQVFEVRDKPVHSPDARRFVERAGAARIPRAGIIAVATKRVSTTPDLLDIAAERQIILEIFSTWEELVVQVAFWSRTPLNEIPASIHKRVYERLVEIEVPDSTLKTWQEIGNRDD